MASVIYGQYYCQWRWMIAVTNNINHPYYDRHGGMGVECYWHKGQYKLFENWLIATLGHRPTSKHLLGRKDKFGDFAPGNLHWELPQQRSRNNPKQNVYVSYRRQKKTMTEWSEQLGIPYYTLRRRISKGIDLKDIIKEFA